MKITTMEKNKDICKASIIILIIWQGLSLVYSPVILPSPMLTLKSIGTIVKDNNFFIEIVITLKRLCIGIFGAVVLGSIVGLLIGANKKAKNLFEPVFHIVQATPPISWLVLAMIWFGLNGEATTFIVFIASLPILIINIVEGFENIDPKLIEMGKTFKFSKVKMFIEIIIPSLNGYFKSGFIIAMGIGWKLVIMGEVLSSSTGIGAQITNARLNIETDRVFAWTIVVILLSVLSQKLIDIAFDFRRSRRKKYDIGNESS